MITMDELQFQSFLKNDQVCSFVLLFVKNPIEVWTFCAFEVLNGAWECDFMSLPAFLLVLTLRILLKNWSFLSCGSGAILGISRAIQTRREKKKTEPEELLQEFERERERPLFWDQLSFYEELVTTDEYFMIGRIMLSWVRYTSDSLCALHARDQICYCSKYENLIQSHI